MPSKTTKNPQNVKTDLIQKGKPKGDAIALGKGLKAFRKSLGLTMQSLSSLIGRNQSMISRIERGVIPPTLKDLLAYKKIGFDFVENLLEDDVSSSDKAGGNFSYFVGTFQDTLKLLEETEKELNDLKNKFDTLTGEVKLLKDKFELYNENATITAEVIQMLMNKLKQLEATVFKINTPV